VLDAAAIKRHMARREIALWASAFGWPALRVLVLGVALGVAIVVFFSETGESIGEQAETSDVLTLGVRYGLLLTLVPAVWAGLSSLAFRLARGWAVIPALTLPVYVIVACWLRQDELRASAAALSAAVSHTIDAHGLAIAQQIAMPGGALPIAMPTDGIPLAGDVPLLLAQAGDTFFEAPVRTALSLLERQVTITLVAALVPGVLVSLLALSIGYRRGFALRHEADLERLRKLDAPRAP